MNNLEGIYHKYIKLPTVLNIEDEISLIHELTAIPFDEIITIKNRKYLLSLFDIIYESHSDNFYGINSSNKAYFENFKEWLESNAVFIEDNKLKAEILSLADMVGVVGM